MKSGGTIRRLLGRLFGLRAGTVTKAPVMVGLDIARPLRTRKIPRAGSAAAAAAYRSRRAMPAGRSSTLIKAMRAARIEAGERF